jgi:hypothetical protein
VTEAGYLLAACGLYCGACYHYRASFPEGRHLLEGAIRQGRAPAEFTCGGCRSDQLYVHPGCAQCQIRACADSRGLLHCGLCVDVPCPRLMSFQGDGRIHHLDIFGHLAGLAVKGPDRWLAEQAERWRCACGTPFSWYEELCPTCGAPLASYGPDPTR